MQVVLFLGQPLCYRVTPVLTTKNKNKMEILIMFIVIAIGFAWAMPQEEIDELDNRLKNKK